MSSGLSMTSVNKIKELAEAKEYSLAVEILDSQNLEKSLNPQFFRVCGEVYENVGRTADARNMYVKAHSMGPESNRILFSLITFYLKQGYFELAEQYAEQYRRNARGAAQELKNIDYVIQKAKGAGPEELEPLLEPYYSHNMDEEWSFELFLLHTLQGKDTEILSSDYMATFRRSAGRDIMQDVLDGRTSAEDLFFVYAEREVPDRKPEEEEIRELEKEVLKKDYLRMHPGAGLGDMDSLEDSGEAEEGAATILESQDTEQKFKSFLKRKFRKKSKDDAEGDETEDAETPEAESGEPEEGEAGEKPSEEVPVQNEPVAAETVNEPQAEEEPAAEPAEEPAAAEPEVPAEEPAKEDRLGRLASRFTDRAKNRNEIQEPETDPLEEMFSVDFDDGFAAESDTISDLAETEMEAYQNPFDLINAYKLDEKEKKAAFEEPKPEPEPIREEPKPEPEPIREEPKPEPEPIREEPKKPKYELKKNPTPKPGPKPIYELIRESVNQPEAEEEPAVEEPVVEEPEEKPIPTYDSEPKVAFEPEPEVEEEPIAAEPEEEPIPWEEPAAEAEPEAEEEPIEEEPVEEEPEEEPIPWEEPAAKPEPIIEKPAAKPEPEAEPEKTAFDVLVEKESEKLDEGLLEEERLQKEAEALLASLGIKL